MKILLSGYYGFGNAGDETILSVLIRELRGRFSQVEIVVLSGTPQETARQHGVRAINRWNLWQMERELRSTHAFISGGGGLIQDRTSRRSALYYLSLIALAHLHCPVFLLGQGIEPLRSPFVRRWAERVLRRVDFAMVRDEASRALLRSWGLSEERLVVGGDLTLLLRPRCFSQSTMAGEREGSFLAVCLKGGLLEDLKIWIARQLDQVSELPNWKIVFFALHPQEDLQEAEEIAQHMKNAPLVLSAAGVPPEELLGCFSGVKALLGMRLHALIFALIAGRPFFALSEDPKIQGLVQHIAGAGGPQISCWNPAKVHEINLVEELARLNSHYDQIRENFQQAGERLYRQTEVALSIVWQKLAQIISAGGESP